MSQSALIPPSQVLTPPSDSALFFFFTLLKHMEGPTKRQFMQGTETLEAVNRGLNADIFGLVFPTKQNLNLFKKKNTAFYITNIFICFDFADGLNHSRAAVFLQR